MARKRKRKQGRAKKILLFLFTPLIIWLLVFVVWFYWNSITPLFQHDSPSITRPKAARNIKQREAGNEGVKEQITDEERKKLDEILKNQAK